MLILCIGAAYLLTTKCTLIRSWYCLIAAKKCYACLIIKARNEPQERLNLVLPETMPLNIGFLLMNIDEHVAGLDANAAGVDENVAGVDENVAGADQNVVADLLSNTFISNLENTFTLYEIVHLM